MAPKPTKKTNGSPTAPDTEALFTQTVVAFGHGTGGLHVTPEAAHELRRQWLVRVRENRTRWIADGAQALEFARVAGRLAAHHSLERGVGVIDATDVAVAIGLLSRSEKGGSRFVEPLRGCPFCR